MSSTAVALRFLGELEVERDGVRQELPPSKKTRGLLAYLALSGRPLRRERLCQLLWDVADDPRGALRWSLSRLRSVVDEPGRPRIRTARDTVAFDTDGAWIDVLELKRVSAAGLESAPVEELLALAKHVRGELLEGLDLGDFLDFNAWCVAEREETRKLHARLLRTLVARLDADPESALPHARSLTLVDPLDDAARVSLIRLLGIAGRRDEAEQRYEAARRLLKELGRTASPELDAAFRSARQSLVAARLPAPPPATGPAVFLDPGLVGREPERGRIVGILEDASQKRRARAVLLTGEPGLGKSRLLAELRRVARALGGTVLEGRAFEAEIGRPFGPWIDALRQLPSDADAGLMAELGALLPEHTGESAAPPSRDRLFAAVVELLSAQAGSPPPIVLTFDDVHWLDAASAELLHFVARTSRQRPLLLALTARAGELFDNEAMQRTLRGLRELSLLEEMPLAPLDRDATRALVGAAFPEVEAEGVVDESAGNPLLALELARALSENGAGLPGSIAELIRHRVERLPAETGDVLRWASVLGRAFDARRLGDVMALELDRLLASLELLERHALLRASDGASSPRGTYEFAHDVVRRAISTELSQPRRRLMHGRIAELLARGDTDETTAAELAHHASLAGENALAARGCVRAGRLFLRQFANAEAWAIARRGRKHAAEVADPERTALVLDLLRVELQARRPEAVDASAKELETLAERALDLGDVEHARLGFHMLAFLRWDEGDLADAQRQMLRAERVGRAGDERDQIVAMAEAARCLVLLERDLPRAEAMALEARARSSRAGVSASAIADAQGMLRQHRGRLDEAAELFEQARLEARRERDAMGEFLALEHLVVLRQQEDAWTESRSLAMELDALGSKLREGSEAPFARALLAFCRLALGEDESEADLEAAAGDLRLADAKLRLAYVLTRAARRDLDAGNARRAKERAAEAHDAASSLGRPTETVLAGLTLARAHRALGDDRESERVVASLASIAAGATEAARRELAHVTGERR